MTATRTMLSVLVALLAALPSEAQVLAPAVVRPSEASVVAEVAVGDTLPTPRREISPVGAVLGGIVGGVAGTFAGMMTGGAIAQGCKGELCALGPVLLGGVIGESVGLATGAHLGSRSSSHGHVAASALASVGILIAGAFLGAGLGQAGAVMVPMTPALQLAAALAIESH